MSVQTAAAALRHSSARALFDFLRMQRCRLSRRERLTLLLSRTLTLHLLLRVLCLLLCGIVHLSCRMPLPRSAVFLAWGQRAAMSARPEHA